jgi:hypothetical protein
MKLIPILALAFSTLYVLLSLLLLAFSVHGPSSLPYFAGGYLVLSLTVLWLIFFRLQRPGTRHPTALFCATGGVLAGFSVLAFLLAHAISSGIEKWTVAHTEVANVHDEPLLSAQGNPIGIRVRFSIRFPRTDFHAPHPYLTPEESFLRETGTLFFLHVIRESVEPEPEKTLYQLSFDMIPNFLVQNATGDKLCVAYPPPDARTRERFDQLLRDQTEIRTRYQLSIWESSYGTPWRGGKEEWTENSYSPLAFYQSARQKGAPDCGPSPNVNF